MLRRLSETSPSVCCTWDAALNEDTSHARTYVDRVKKAMLVGPGNSCLTFYSPRQASNGFLLLILICAGFCAELISAGEKLYPSGTLNFHFDTGE